MAEEKSFVESSAEMFKILREENRETKRDLNKRIDDIDKKIDSVIAENRETKRDLNKRMDILDKKIDDANNSLNKRIDGLDKRMDRIENRMDKLENKLDKGFEDLNAKFDDFRKDIIQQFKENRSEGLSFNRQGQVLTGSIVAAIAAVIYSILK